MKSLTNRFLKRVFIKHGKKEKLESEFGVRIRKSDEVFSEVQKLMKSNKIM